MSQSITSKLGCILIRELPNSSQKLDSKEDWTEQYKDESKKEDPLSFFRRLKSFFEINDALRIFAMVIPIHQARVLTPTHLDVIILGVVHAHKFPTAFKLGLTANA